MSEATTAMRNAAIILADTLDQFALCPRPLVSIGSDPNGLQDVARQISGRLRSLDDDKMEAYLIGSGGVSDLHGATSGMDHHGGNTDALVRHALMDAFRAAIVRRDDRDGFRRDPHGFRQRRTAEGHWENF